MNKRKLAEYYYHNDYSLDVALHEIKQYHPEVTREWLAEVFEECGGDDLPF